MDPSYFIKGILLGLLVTVPLGPVAIVCIQKTIGKGWRSGMFGGLGAVAADTCFALIAGFGVSFVVEFLQKHVLPVQLAGIAVLMAVAGRIFFSNPAVQARRLQRKKVKGWEDFATTYFLTLSNPATIFVFMAAFAGFVLKSGSGIVQLLTVVLGIATGAAGWWYLIISTVNRFRHRIRLKNLWWINKITGACIFAFAVALLVKVILTYLA
ncbi:MAG: LysE family transporter [Bacteroidales bacterium]|nr:LysE family transporter [Bacteroidales bacterium]